MKCVRCGKNNPTNTHHCVYCGTPMQTTKRKKDKSQTESAIVALIIVLFSLLVFIMGVYIYKNNYSHKKGFGSGGGGGALPTPSSSTNEGSPSHSSEDVVDNEKPPKSEKPKQSTQSTQNEQQKPSEKRLEQKNIFLDKAHSIERYSENNLETAQSQSELNRESSVVFKKWDDLLNEVYRYLKTIMTENEFRQLEKDESAWVTQKERAIEESGKEWEGGSGEPMARNLTAIRYTMDRCYYLISLIN